MGDTVWIYLSYKIKSFQTVEPELYQIITCNSLNGSQVKYSYQLCPPDNLSSMMVYSFYKLHL